jgi:hypothetical protein
MEANSVTQDVPLLNSRLGGDLDGGRPFLLAFTEMSDGNALDCSWFCPSPRGGSTGRRKSWDCDFLRKNVLAEISIHQSAFESESEYGGQ